MQYLGVRRVKFSEDLLNPGEYVFIAARPPEITAEKKAIVAPVGFLKTLWCALFSKKYELVETKSEAWPSVDSIIIVCPRCSVPYSVTSTGNAWWFFAMMERIWTCRAAFSRG
jgi:hypothetical protein